MPKHEDAKLILQLYDLRREKVMREARTWFATEFHPNSAEDFIATMRSHHGAYLRMVGGYWDMAAALVNHGAIDAALFQDTNGEYLFYYAKVEPFLAELRKLTNPGLLANLEKLIKATPGAGAKLPGIREHQKDMAAAAQGR